MTQVEQYADREIDERAARAVENHLAACRDCTAFFDQLRVEQVVYARFERDVEVTPVMWAAVEARIRGEKSHDAIGALSKLRQWFIRAAGAPRLSPAMAAALVAIAVGITLGLMSVLKSRGPTPAREVAVEQSNAQPAESRPPEKEAAERGGQDKVAATGNRPRGGGPTLVRRDPTPEQLVREAEQKYLQAIALLSRDIRQRRSHLSPIVLARFDSALTEVDRAIAETRRAVRQNPGDPIALQYLLAAYSKKVDALREMATD